jgi:hypothetical protein
MTLRAISARPSLRAGGVVRCENGKTCYWGDIKDCQACADYGKISPCFPDQLNLDRFGA